MIAFSASEQTDNGLVAVSYTGILRSGTLETLWHIVAGTVLGRPGRRTGTIDRVRGVERS